MIFLPKVEIKSNLRPVGVSPTERSKYLMVIREFFLFFSRYVLPKTLFVVPRKTGRRETVHEDVTPGMNIGIVVWTRYERWWKKKQNKTIRSDETVRTIGRFRVIDFAITKATVGIHHRQSRTTQYII